METLDPGTVSDGTVSDDVHAGSTNLLSQTPDAGVSVSRSTGPLTTLKHPRRRGRHAKDPLGKCIYMQCQRLEDMVTQLKSHLALPNQDAEHTTLVFSFPTTAAFMVPKREPVSIRDPDKRVQHMYSVFNKTAVSVIDALQTIQDPKEQALTQRAISKTLTGAIQQADGFRYSFHNSWLSREDQASRFSYYCNDSVLNKGRAANEGAAMVRNGVKVRKPVYDCEGLLCIKFSSTKMSLEVHYKHIPLHKTYEERAPPPRRDSKRRKLMEVFHPGSLPKIKSRSKKSVPAVKSPPDKKRPTTEPISQTPDATGGEQASQQRQDSSLQPLFDFLGSAGRITTDSPALVSSHSPADNMAPENESLMSSGDAVPEMPSKPVKDLRYPGMMSGYMVGSSLTWGLPIKKRPTKREQRAQYRARAKLAASVERSVEAPRKSPVVTVSQPTDPVSELEALRAELEAAQAKIRALENEKIQSSTPIRWNTAIQPPNLSPEDYGPNHPPSQQHHLPHSGYPYYPQLAVQYPYHQPSQWQSYPQPIVGLAQPQMATSGNGPPHPQRSLHNVPPRASGMADHLSSQPQPQQSRHIPNSDENHDQSSRLVNGVSVANTAVIP